MQRHKYFTVLVGPGESAEKLLGMCENHRVRTEITMQTQQFTLLGPERGREIRVLCTDIDNCLGRYAVTDLSQFPGHCALVYN